MPFKKKISLAKRSSETTIAPIKKNINLSQIDLLNIYNDKNNTNPDSTIKTIKFT
jgi:hypothetical protein